MNVEFCTKVSIKIENKFTVQTGGKDNDNFYVTKKTTKSHLIILPGFAVKCPTALYEV